MCKNSMTVERLPSLNILSIVNRCAKAVDLHTVIKQFPPQNNCRSKQFENENGKF